MAKYKNSTKEDPIKEATKRLEQGIIDFMSSDKFREYLKVMSRFHTYSYSNSILIAMQIQNQGKDRSPNQSPCAGPGWEPGHGTDPGQDPFFPYRKRF